MSTPGQNLQIYSLPYLYVSGMNVSIASTTVLAIAPGQARDIFNAMDMPVSFQNLDGNVYPPVLFQNYQQPLFLSSAVNGVNGLDSGVLLASTQYAVYLIGDSSQNNPTAGLMSLASNAYPLMPAGYDSLRLLAFVETDGAAHFVYATHQPQSVANASAYYLSPPVSVLAGGNATTWTAVDLNAAVPSGALPNVIVEALVTFVPSAVGDTVMFRPTGSAAVSGVPLITGLVANVAQTQYLQLVAGVNGGSHASVDYQVTSAGDSVTVLVAGWVGSPHMAYPV